MYYSIFYWWVGVEVLAYMAASVSVCYVAILIATLKNANLFLVFRGFIVITYIAFLTEILYTGGVNSSVLPHLLYIPLLSLFFGRRSDLTAFFSLTFSTVLGLVIYQIILKKELPELPQEYLQVFNFLNYIFIFLAVLPLSFIFKSQLRASNKKLKKSLVDQQHTYNQLLHSEKLASIGQLTAGIAHEINNPVNYMQGGATVLSNNFEDLNDYENNRENFLRSLQTMLADESNTLDVPTLKAALDNLNQKKEELQYNVIVDEINTVLGSIQEGSRRIVDIVKVLRSFSRKNDVFSTSFDLHEGLESTLLLLKKEHFDRIEIKKEFGKTPLIECNPGNINQVFMNLLTNATQSIKKTGTIRIETDHDKIKDEVIVRIEDSGSGITPKNKDKIFDPFFTTKEVGMGTGLGLSITKSIIESHHGQITVESAINQGTTFTVTLPVHQKEEVVSTTDQG